MIPRQLRTELARVSGDAFRSDLCRRLFHSNVGSKTTVDWLNDVMDICNNAFATSASANKIAFVFRLPDAHCAFKFFHEA